MLCIVLRMIVAGSTGSSTAARVKVVHILTGETMNTNAKAAQHLLHSIKKISRDLGGLQCCSVVIKCAFHQLQW